MIVFKTIDDCIGAGPHTLVWINSKGLEDWKIRFSKGSCHNAHQSYLQYMILKEKELLEQELYD